MNKRKVKYTDERMGKLKVIPDFLPGPKDLAFKDETVKVTLSLTKESVDFFKKEAEAHHAHYQQMIRTLLDQYAAHHDARE